MLPLNALADLIVSSSEVARRHAKACAGKANDPPPPQAKRGRKVRACDKCSQYKVSCDARNPCSRCVSQNKTCTYERLNGDNGSSDLANTKAPFLLNFTAPSNESTIPSFFLDGSWTVNEDAASCHRMMFDSPEDVLTGYQHSVLDPPGLGNYYEQGFGLEVAEEHHNGVFEESNVFADTAISWELRIDEILRHLWVTYNDMLRSGVEGCSAFDMEFARTVFSMNNVKHFVWSYFHSYHDELPIIHRPTFQFDTAAPELLLAIIMGGAAFSAPLDDALSARRLLPLADEFIYAQLSRRIQSSQTGKSELRSEDIQSLQAAIIVGITQSGFNDVQTRRRLKSRRHPQLASTLRSLGVLSSRRRASGTWQDFIEDETRVR